MINNFYCSGHYLKKLRTDRNLSIRELAQECKIDPSNLAKVEKGRLKLPVNQVSIISEKLRLSFDEFSIFLHQIKFDLDMDTRNKLKEIKYHGE